MLLTFTEDAWTDYCYWQNQDRKTLKRINKLIKDIQRDPFSGIGKPERKTPIDRKSTRLNSSHSDRSRMPSSA